MKTITYTMGRGKKTKVAKEKRTWLKKKALKAVPYLVLGFCILIGTYCPAFASSGNATNALKDILQQFIDIICMVFSGIGIIIAAYCVGKGVLALRNDDVDGQQRAAQGLIVAFVLIVIGPVINGLNLVDQLYTY